MKRTTNNQSEPPAAAGGLTRPSSDGEVTEPELQPPAAAGGTHIAADDATLTLLREENEQLKTSIRLDRAHRRITGELERVGARSPGLLFDSVKSDLQFTDDGEVVNAAAIINRLKQAFPEQFGYDRAASIDAGAGRNQPPPLTREALAKMKTEEIAALDWNDVRRVLTNG